METLRARISSLESANRETIAVLDSKSIANDALAQDLQKQHQKGLELSQQLTASQQAVQTAQSAASSAKFREQSLKQEVVLAKRNNEWFEAELKTKSSEALKYRKEKGAKIAELQRLNDELNSNVEALKRTEQALRSRVDEIQKKAEDSFSKVQQLQEAAAKTEEGFHQELESSRRLAELQSQQTETHRNRLREVEATLERAKDDAAEEVGRCRQEAEVERHDREQAEHRIAELEADIDRLEGLIASRPLAGSVPGTPRQGVNGTMFGRSGSPAFFGTPGSARSKPAMTATQAVEESFKLKAQLTTETRKYGRLKDEFDDLLQALEAKQPELEEMQAEHDRLQQEVVEMSKFVDQTGKERDRAKKDARKAESEASTAQAECDILRQQLRDLSAQIKLLVCELDARERGLETLSATERAQLERLARGEVSEDALEGMTDTDRLISQRLTVFRSVSELQEKNEALLKITRQLGAQMESEEARKAKDQAAKDHEEVQSLQAKIENYKDELQSMVTRSESYVKERDMFRRMLQHRGQIPQGSDQASLFGQSVDGNQNGLIPTIEQTPGNRDSANYATLLREQQAQFDHYREEQAIDRRTIKEQMEKLSLEKGSLQGEIAKMTSQLTLASERHDMLQSNYSMQQNENDELKTRSQILSESAAKQDLRTQQVAEDLVEAKGTIESMRNETANLKAEKKIWKDIQDRLSQDNENLMNEKTRLNNLITNQQTLQNERELSDSESRHRLQSQVDSLEAQLTTIKRKLNDEVEDNKKAQLRKEYDSQQNQKRIDDLATSLSHVREDLVAAKTTRDHLQSRVDELTIELKSAEERVELLQPRPTPRSAAGTDIDPEAAQSEALSREQQLAIEVSELNRNLELAKSELESTKSQMDQYKAISQSSEEELQSLNATQDQYREEMDRIIEEKDSKIRELQQRADDISAELTTTNNELTKVRNQQAEIARQFEEEKATMEAEITRLKDEDDRHATTAQFHQQDLRAQAAIATKAQQDYENELVKHAEAAKLVQNLRAEYNQLKTESATLRSEAESARVTLSQSESSWDERREQFEQELTELRTRRDDINAQNKLLHQQLENVGGQISALQQSRASNADVSESDLPAPDATFDRTADGLRELNSFLRREKEIVEVQYDLKIQEAKRLQQQLDYTQSQLDESRLKLDQERRLHADVGRSSLAQKDIMDKLNELKLFRESSITLRHEARQAQDQLAEKTKRVDELVEQIQPLENKIRELEHGKETTEGELRLVQEDRDRWQKRTSDIISKYDRIDPAEMEQLKETIESLKTERDSLLEGQQPLQEKVDALEAEKATWQQTRQKITDQAKERNRQQTSQIRDLTTEKDSVNKEREALQQELSPLRSQLATALREKEIAEQQAGQIVETLTAERDQALATRVSAASTLEVPSPLSVESNTTGALERQLTELRTQLDVVTKDKQSLELQLANPGTQNSPNPLPVESHSNETLELQLTELRTQLDAITKEKQLLGSQLADMRTQLELANSERDTAVTQAAEAVLQPVQQTDISNGNDHEDGQIDETVKESLSDEEKQALEGRIASAETKAKEAEQKLADLEAQLESKLKSRSEQMKTALNRKLVESKEAQRVALEAEFEAKFEEGKKAILAGATAQIIPVAVATDSSKAEEGKEPAAPSTPIPKTLVTGALDLSALTDPQARELLQNNNTMRQVFLGNIRKKVSEETQKVKTEQEAVFAKGLEAERQKVKTEQEALTAEMLAEAQRKAEAAQAQAVLMTEKRSSLKMNMADNRAKGALAKIEVVETAARETPTKPVSEVWEVAKLAKPAPAATTGEQLCS